MSHIRKASLLIILTAVVAVAGTYMFLENKPWKFVTRGNFLIQTGHKPFVYGTLDNYFTGQDSIIYPLIFDDIRIIGAQKSPAINFGPQNFEGFEIFMSVTKMVRKDANNFKSILMERGHISEGPRSTINGYVGEILSSDVKAHPEPNSQTCNFGYNYFIPLENSKNDLILEVNASQPEFGLKPDIHCIIFEDQNYMYLKAMMDHVIANIVPAF